MLPNYFGTIVLTLMGASSTGARQIDERDLSLKAAVEFRRYIASDVIGAARYKLDGTLLKATLGNGGWIFDFADGWVAVMHDRGRRVEAFATFPRTEEADPSWSELNDLTNNQLLAIVMRYYRKAGFLDNLKFEKCERRGSDGLPHGNQRFWRIDASRLFGTIPTSLRVSLQFDIDADTHQLLGMNIDPGPLTPASLTPRITLSEASAIAFSEYLNASPGMELSLTTESSLRVWDPSNTVRADDLTVAPDVRQSIAESRGILAYELGVCDVRWSEPVNAPAAYVVVEAQSGRILYKTPIGSGLGGTLGKNAPNRKWGTGPFSLIDCSRIHRIKAGRVTAVPIPSRLSKGIRVTLLSGDVAFHANYHAKEGVLTRMTAKGMVCASPNAVLRAELNRMVDKGALSRK